MGREDKLIKKMSDELRAEQEQENDIMTRLIEALKTLFRFKDLERIDRDDPSFQEVKDVCFYVLNREPSMKREASRILRETAGNMSIILRQALIEEGLARFFNNDEKE